MIITIDGPTGTGKSTIAKLLAERIGFAYFDTGAMYRCLTYGIIKHRIDYNDPKAVEKFISSFDFEVRVIKKAKLYFYEDEDITDKIRKEAVTTLVSQISAMSLVREKLVKHQRKLGEGANAVFEGRDMGTVVFPNAALKIYLTADPKIRAQRRFDELREKSPEETVHMSVRHVLDNLNTRDSYDSSREHSPLYQAKDAHIIDTTHLSVEEVLNKILDIFPK
ncbi:MAG TPA: (d)CMP kinase [Waddliaceae bacterium]